MDGTSNFPSNGCQNYDLSKLTEKLQAVFTAPWNGLMLDNSASYDLNNVQHRRKETDPHIPSIGQVKNALNALKVKKATSIDGFPAWFLKQYSEDLALVAYNIITSSIIQCKYPTLYKQALITPVPKNIETDFRQISVLPQLVKVLEKIQLKLNCADITLKDNQHAFPKGRSTLSALIEISQKWFDETENNAHGRKEDEITANLTFHTSKCADDCTLDQAVGAGEISHVQQALDIIQCWSESNKMTINVKKAKDYL
ncbi:Hypothetical predicted protein [Paramuricea clavata]|uniref:Uncharacterized protein n=1 Tax=Paramuricea clavata TaxID=317549 RepID=A0A7D9DHR8_PARCT|nr:Hypothetical predicted protein [Paramuricea clavata]